MKKYVYKAKDKNGAIVTGQVEASSDYQAAKLLREKGLIVFSIAPQRQSLISFLTKLRERATFGQIVTFTRQLATMINAGLPITESLYILRKQTSGVMQGIISQILADVEGGGSLSSSIAKHSKVFSPTYIALIKSGEVGGVLDNVLQRLADNLEKQQEFNGKIKGALVYPIIILVGMIAVGMIMMIFVVPKLLGIYAEFEAELPLPTKALIFISGFMSKYWFLVIGAIFAIVYGFILYRKTTAGRRKIDELLLRIPLVGPLLKEIILTEVTQTLSLMVGSGVSILDGLRISADVVNNVVVSSALEESALDVEKGFPVAYAFARHPDAFPYILSQMMAVGEETGKTDEVLGKLSHIFELECDQKVKALTSAFEPLIMVVLGIGVGFLVVSIILPIYNLTSQF